MLSQKFGEYIKKTRLEIGLTLRAAAKKIGINHSRLSEIERGTNFRSDTPTTVKREHVLKIAKLYNIPSDFLLKMAGYYAPPLNTGKLPEEEEIISMYKELDNAHKELVRKMIKEISQVYKVQK